MRSAQNKKRSVAKARQDKIDAQVTQAHQAYIDQARSHLDKIQTTLTKLTAIASTELLQEIEIESYIKHAERQIDQIERRVIKGEVIPHEEKVFSLFEPHTEWISKGKAGVPVELGVKVCILEDQHQFILHHHVMEKQTDDQIAVSMIAEAKKRFPKLNACSFDKGFHSPANQAELIQHLDQFVGIARDAELPLLQVLLDDRRAAPFAIAVIAPDLLARQRGVARRAEVDGRILAVGDAGVIELTEEPL